uniref:NADH-ubiquinone oxidoreductase chain 5 n=1 Tax=Trigonopterus sp. 5 AH-2016 TaxID=1903839 RepID=A0A343C470_9CUCU|nr:NADH dehydrogenase subunit 5 [Trigonopterus sp. 5 AH-2016]
MVLYQLYFWLFLLLSIVGFASGMSFLHQNFEVFIEFELLSFNSVSLELTVLLDWVSLIFSSFVFFISSMIVMYSWNYMSDDKSTDRFIYIVVFFVLSMMVVIFSSNLVFILLGWDGLGLVSYALVIYYQNVKSYNAGMLTALSNRVGDASILIGIALMVDSGSWNYFSSLENFYCLKDFLGLGLLIVLASMTKSAQIPFSSWLPAAMAAPTPVSSLVHSSTLVTAGVYLLFRFSDLLSHGLELGFMYFSLFTMFMAGLGASFEFDLKKVIALSTLSQLGMMMTIFFLGSKELAFFHLLMHALFKALLFMCAGVMIHSLAGCQDIRFMGGMVRFFPVSCMCFCISNFALCGLPFLSGFYSKDLVAEVLSMSVMSLFVYSVFYMSVGLTVLYSMRLIFYVFMGHFNMFSLKCMEEKNSSTMLKSMISLVILVIFMGSIFSWVSVVTPYFIILPNFMKLMTVFMIFTGVILGYEVSCSEFIWNSNFYDFYQVSMFSSGMWNLPVLSTTSLNSWILIAGKLYIKNVDYGWAEYYGSKGIFSMMKYFSKFLQLFVYNHLKVYLLMFWVIFLIMSLYFIL